MSVGVEPAGEMLMFTGRDAWALQRLMEAGEEGITPIDSPGPRWSAYVHSLRRTGLALKRFTKAMAGHFPATTSDMCSNRRFPSQSSRSQPNASGR